MSDELKERLEAWRYVARVANDGWNLPPEATAALDKLCSDGINLIHELHESRSKVTDYDRLKDLQRQTRLRAERAEAELASLADTIASAHRNTEMSGEGVEHDLREAVWQLSYRANDYRVERDALRALKKTGAE